jgi:hypothetical protein
MKESLKVSIFGNLVVFNMENRNNLKHAIEEFKKSMMNYAMQLGNEYTIDYWNFFFNNAETFHTTLNRSEYEKLKEKLIFVKPKECYDNAILWSVVSKGKYLYYEGYATSILNYPFPHAWNIENGRVFDTTLYKDYEDLDEEIMERLLNEEVIYIGVNVPYEDIIRYLNYEDECNAKHIPIEPNKTPLQYYFEEKTGRAKYEIPRNYHIQ